MVLERIDQRIIYCTRCAGPWVARGVLFVIFFWFGILKPIGVSSAIPLVVALQTQTLPFLSSESFVVFLGAVEMLIGILFLIPRAERAAIALLLLHMLTTFMPLVFLPGIAWQAPFVPTLEGQYIIKNLVIIVVAVGIAANLAPIRGHR